MRYVFLLYLIICPLFVWVGSPLRISQELCFQTCSILVVFLGMFFENKKIERNMLNISIGSVGILFLGLYMLFMCSTGFSVFLNVFFGLGVYFTFIRTVDKEDLRFIFQGLLVVLAITSVYLFSAKMGYDPLFSIIDTSKENGILANTTDLTGTFGIKALMGVYFAICLPIVLSMNPIVALFMIVPLAASRSTAAMLGGLGGGLFYYFFNKRLVFWALLPCIVAGFVGYLVLIDNPMGMQTSRFDMWQKVFSDGLKKAGTGHGLDSFRVGQLKYFKNSWNDETHRAVRVVKDGQKTYKIQGEIPEKAQVRMKERQEKGLRGQILDEWDHPHNEFLWLLFEGSIFGCIIVGFALYFIWIRFKYAYHSTMLLGIAGSLAAVLLCCTTQFCFHVARIAHLIPILLGAFYVESNMNRETP